MYTERINLHKQISDSQKILREKFKKFKQGEHYVQDKVNKVFKPIIEPLNKLVESSTVQKKRKEKFQHSTPETSDFEMNLNDDDNYEDDDDDGLWKFATADEREIDDIKHKLLKNSSQNCSDTSAQNLSKTINEPSLLNVKNDLQKKEPEIDNEQNNDMINSSRSEKNTLDQE